MKEAEQKDKDLIGKLKETVNMLKGEFESFKSKVEGEEEQKKD